VNDTCEPAEPVPATFVASPEAWRFAGTLTLFNSQTVYEATLAAPLPESGRIEFGGVTHADSAAIALLIELRRRARTEGRELVFDGLSPALTTLAGVYGIEDVVGTTAS
jgi:phospholipid transport system transporter-binding protein